MTLQKVTGHREPEAYVNRHEMARQLGVCLGSLDKMVREGRIPSETWGLRTRRFLPSLVKRTLAVGNSGRSVVSARPERRDVGARPKREDAA